MHKGDYHTDYSKYYDKEYKDKDLAFEHIKKLKEESRKEALRTDEKQVNVTHVVKKKKYMKKTVL